MELSNIIALGLATFRLSLMITQEEGPFSAFFKLRIKFGAYDYDESGEPDTVLGRGISCPLCVGMYAAFLFVALNQIPYGWFVVLLFAVAGIQVLIFRLFKSMQVQRSQEEG